VSKQSGSISTSIPTPPISTILSTPPISIPDPDKAVFTDVQVVTIEFGAIECGDGALCVFSGLKEN
jgi:hypothetical protein